jgi:hypothetical protein
MAPEACAQTWPACGDGVFNCRNVKVTVDGGRVSLDPATVTVTGRAPPAVKIVWYLVTPGYSFVDQPGGRPVHFPAEYFMSNDPRFCYTYPSEKTALRYVCTDWNADAFAWGTDYTITVVPASGGSPITASGRVVNN